MKTLAIASAVVAMWAIAFGVGIGIAELIFRTFKP